MDFAKILLFSYVILEILCNFVPKMKIIVENRIPFIQGLLDAVADVAYREAVKVVAVEAIKEAQKEDLLMLEKGKQKVMSPEIKMKQKERELVAEWFEKAANTLKKKAKSIFEKVVEALRLPAFREAAKEKIKEQAKPSIHELLRTYQQKSQETRTQRPRQHSWEER